MIIEKALIIDEPWISKILSGEKVWEMRSKPTRIRGSVALIRKGSGMVVGLVDIKDVSGPYSDAELSDHEDNHHVSQTVIQNPSYKWRYAWHLENVKALRTPVAYQHPSGAVTWVNLAPDVSESVTKLTYNADTSDSAELNSQKNNNGSTMRSKIVVKGGSPRSPDGVDHIPKAKDGTTFHAGLKNKRETYTVGDKGDEKTFTSYHEAIAYLRTMPTARWRRPNEKGNYGIVSAVEWVDNTEVKGA